MGNSQSGEDSPSARMAPGYYDIDEPLMSDDAITSEQKRGPSMSTSPRALIIEEADDNEATEYITVPDEILNGALYVVKEPLWIFSTQGHPSGEPLKGDHMLFQVPMDQIVLLQKKRPRLDSDGNTLLQIGSGDDGLWRVAGSEDYTRVLLPVKGWIFHPGIASSLIKLDDCVEEDGTLLPDKLHASKIAILPKKSMFEDDEEPTTLDKITSKPWVRKSINYLRKNPYFLTTIVLIVLGCLELLVVSDLIFDSILAKSLYENDHPYYFMVSCVLMTAPYWIAWCALFGFLYKKSLRHKGELKYGFLQRIFQIAPFGLVMIVCHDFIRTFECFIVKPLYFMCFNKHWRVESYEEQGYYLLRRVSEVFAESICQSILQLFILLKNGQSNDLGIETWKVIASLASSAGVVVMYMTVLYFEAQKNGLYLFEYVCVVYQGSFNFVPKLPAVRRGAVNGDAVSWVNYTVTNEAVGGIAVAVVSPLCRLHTVKLSPWSIRKCHRPACKYFGRLLKQAFDRYIEQDGWRQPEILISRDEELLKYIFEQFDVNGDLTFDIQEFARVMLVLRSVTVTGDQWLALARITASEFNEATGDSKMGCVSVRELGDLYQALANKVGTDTQQIWLFDLLFKVNSSIARLPLLDHDLPLFEAVRTRNVRLVSLLIGAGYASKLNHIDEFNYCVIEAVLNNHYRTALALCENKGVPIVIQIDRALNLNSKSLAKDPYLALNSPSNIGDYSSDTSGRDSLNTFVHVSFKDTELQTTVIPATNNPRFNQFLLLIVPFDLFDTFVAPIPATPDVKPQDKTDLNIPLTESVVISAPQMPPQQQQSIYPTQQPIYPSIQPIPPPAFNPFMDNPQMADGLQSSYDAMLNSSANLVNRHWNESHASLMYKLTKAPAKNIRIKFEVFNMSQDEFQDRRSTKLQTMLSEETDSKQEEKKSELDDDDEITEKKPELKSEPSIDIKTADVDRIGAVKVPIDIRSDVAAMKEPHCNLTRAEFFANKNRFGLYGSDDTSVSVQKIVDRKDDLRFRSYQQSNPIITGQLIYRLFLGTARVYGKYGIRYIDYGASANNLPQVTDEKLDCDRDTDQFFYDIQDTQRGPINSPGYGSTGVTPNTQKQRSYNM